ncbi:MAG: CPBP family intramembrane metalloprotease [Chitinophaga sp.]|uniref:CPBP family intramembrane glutamic endopeptidase n=1 Tax=Chitinophaga sp. TaxID=1869181 RepID=UPI0025BDF447|nr:CPBP family intramembrane glutamic endopeptidase [Chitinophaga sp.]MBV8254744.1 CPBP family intramembrane metalloprotease [Chitinophaga sp.]
MRGYLKQHPPILQFITIIGFYVGFLAVYLLLMGVLIPKLTGYTFIGIQEGILTNPALIWPQRIIQFSYSVVTFLVPAAVFAHLWQPYPTQYMGLATKPSWMQVILTIVLFMCALPFVGALAEWNQSWNVPASAREMQAKAEMLTKALLRMPTMLDLCANLLLMAIVPAITEEVFFRGVLQRILINMTRMRWMSVIFTAIIFSAVHFEIMGFAPRIALGFILGAIYLITGNLWLTILAHTINNGMLVISFYLFQHGMTHTDPSKDDFLPWYYAAFSLVVTVGLFWALIKRSPEPIQVDPPVSEEEEDD